MKSKTALFHVLAQINSTKWGEAPKLQFKTKGINCEVFGKQACVFVWCDSEEQRHDTEDALEARGFKIDRKYYPGGCGIMVLVSYFKGWHFDE
jgi:hypothetical protein